VAGATRSSDALGTADVGFLMRVQVTASNRYGSASAFSAVTAAVKPAAAPPALVSAPAISGTARVQATLTASTGTWANAPTSYAYQWQRCGAGGGGCANIAAATTGTYVLVAADLGRTVRVRVTASNHYGSSSASSPVTGVVQPPNTPPVLTAPPTISGTAEELGTLTALPGSWQNDPTDYAYQWQLCDVSGGACVDAPGASGTTFSPSFGDVGRALRVSVTASNPYGSASALSAPTPPVRAVSLSLPVRAAFYYAWYPEGFSQTPHYTPSLGLYNSGDPNVIRQQISALQYGGIQAGIYSWDRTSVTNDAVARFPTVLSASQGTGFKWAVYYEAEGYGDPDVATIRSDLEYIRANYASSSSYLRVGGRPVVFVYSSPGDGCAMSARWNAANTIGAYLVLSDPWVDNEPLLSSTAPYGPTSTAAVRVAAGDLDGDGKAEVVTAPGAGTPLAITVSSGTGTQLASFPVADMASNAGAFVAVGDVAGDGRPEIVVGAADGSRIDVFSYQGGTATELTSFAPGLANGARLAVGDVLGTGKAQIVAASGAGTAPQVAIFTGDGSRIGGFAPYDASFTKGVSVAAGDVTGDGRADIVLGSANGTRTEVRVVDANGNSLLTPFEAYPGFGGALSVATADVDGDGLGDIVTGAAGGPHVRTFTTRLGRPSGLGSFFAYDPSTNGQIWVAAADVAGEGTADVVVGSAPGQPSQARVYGNVRDCASQPDAWHEYLVTASGEAGMGRDAFTVSPGLWRSADASPSLPRDPARWSANVADLAASGAEWQLVLSFNEWTESTSVESASQWASASGYGTYLDALHGAFSPLAATEAIQASALRTGLPAGAPPAGEGLRAPAPGRPPADFPLGHQAGSFTH
jgi:hypothetical protein